jgi:hypothetical protein
MHELKWNEREGYGYLHITPRDYDAEYFDKYVGYQNTEMGKRITQARIDFVAKHYDGPVIDIGIGSGHFVASRPGTYGYDVNPKGIEWLQNRGLYIDPLTAAFYGYTFFDSFEHIKDPSYLLASICEGAKVFISIPIFKDMPHVLRSKHFRPDEHYWYFTGLGFVLYMLRHGFHLIAADDFETRIGREDITSFAFIKR